MLYVPNLQEAVKNALMNCQKTADAEALANSALTPLPLQPMHGLAALSCTMHAENACREHTQLVPAMLKLPGSTGTKARTAPQECPCHACHPSSPAAAAC